jgi:hypothetical protein
VGQPVKQRQQLGSLPHNLANFSDPSGSLVGRTHDYRLEVPPMKVFNTAETKNAGLPQVF